jgi:hypothetical protein
MRKATIREKGFDIFVWYKKEACMLGVRTSTSKVPGQEIVGDGNSSFEDGTIVSLDSELRKLTCMHWS